VRIATGTSPLVAPIFEAGQAASDQAALCAGRDVVTYGELAQDVALRRESLRRAGVAPGDRVAILLPKSIATVETILAILAVDAVYVPLNARAQPAQIARVLADIRPKLLVTDRDQVEAILAIAPELRIAVPAGNGAEFEFVPPRYPLPGAERVAPEQIAAVLYSSGSTGEPKGIMLSHANIASFVDWAVRTFDMHAEDRLASHAPLYFDLSLFDIFGALARHATLCLLDETSALFPGQVRDFVDANRISIWYSVPSALMRLQERHAFQGLQSLRLVLFAGEVFPTPILRRLMADLPTPEYVNLYGPTETNVCTYHRLPGVPREDTETLPIGRACEHLEVTIRDAQGHALPADATGEICVAGPAVMQGYWQRPALTEETRLAANVDSYRTGDYGTRTSGGLFHFVGRRDQQVKLRGHRIELMALESVMHTHPDVKEAAACVLPDARSGGVLTIFLAPFGAAPARGEVLNFIAERLPPAYRPDRIEVVEALPRTANGKCDRTALLARVGGAATSHGA
jgi:amino acid adenylation domain-containing protein